MRKPIQIAAVQVGRSADRPNGQCSYETAIVALCDDGSLWRSLGTDGEWIPLPAIPQGPLLDDWMTDVAAILTEYHIRPDATGRVLEAHRAFVDAQYHAGVSASETAKALAERLK